MLRLTTDEIIIYPTDTVYGIGADATNPENYRKINKIKERKWGGSEEKPISVMFHSLEQVKKFIKLSKENEKIIEKNLEGHFTFLVPKKLKKQLYIGTSDKIGIRIANTKTTKMLTEDFPVLSTSANITGNPGAKSIEEMPKGLVSKCKVINGGTLPGTASTIIDLENKKIIRKGPSSISW